MRIPINWYLGGLCALALVAAPPQVCHAQEAAVDSAAPGLDFAVPVPVPTGCCEVGTEDMAPSAMDSSTLHIQGETRPRRPDVLQTEHYSL